ncbi:MAG: MGMT family protein [Candidatus Shapirobacteria bacterium]|nr:MGMT family protein [Candidatus Shapirobacteria bacterium]
MLATFKNRVYQVVAQIPKGKVATYGQIAKLAGNKKAARAVGALMKNNPYAPKVACHRVVGFDGRLTGYSGQGGITKKKQWLISEGVIFKKEKVDLEKCLWRQKYNKIKTNNF